MIKSVGKWILLASKVSRQDGERSEHANVPITNNILLVKLAMVHELINQTVDVLVAFNKKKATPLFFKWGNRKYKVDKVNLIHSVLKGANKVYYFSITSQNNFFKLCFDTDNNHWTLEEAYYGS